MSWLVTAYYTVNTPYEQEAKRLIPSLQKFNVPYFVSPVTSRGNWYKNTQWKPLFLKEMLEKFAPKSIVYVDVDAEFFQYPDLFDQLDQRPDVHVGVHLLNHPKRGRPQAGFEMLSGTIFLRNSTVTHQILDKWIAKCNEGGTLWDQVALKVALGDTPYYILPEEYCVIFDYMSDVQNPVIKHYQASRRCKDMRGPTPGEEYAPARQGHQPNVLGGPPTPRKITAGGLVRYHRTWRGLETI